MVLEKPRGWEGWQGEGEEEVAGWWGLGWWGVEDRILGLKVHFYSYFYSLYCYFNCLSCYRSAK